MEELGEIQGERREHGSRLGRQRKEYDLKWRIGRADRIHGGQDEFALGPFAGCVARRAYSSSSAGGEILFLPLWKSFPFLLKTMVMD